MNRFRGIREHIVTALFVAALCAFFGFMAFSQMPPSSFPNPPTPVTHTHVQHHR